MHDNSLPHNSPIGSYFSQGSFQNPIKEDVSDDYRFRGNQPIPQLVLTISCDKKEKSQYDILEVYTLISTAPNPYRLFFPEILNIKSDGSFRTIIMPGYGPSIYEILKDNTYRGFNKLHCQQIAFEILSAVDYLHRSGMIHTNLSSHTIRFRTDKSNLITDAHSTYFLLRDVRIILCDLTECRRDGEYSDRIQMDIYRAPEVILGIGWNQLVDCWSIGCILAEIYCGSPFFESQKNTPDPDLYQLTHMMTYCGIVPYSMIEKAPVKFSQYPKKEIFTKNHFCVGNPDFKDVPFIYMYRIIRGLMNYDPLIRMTCQNALQSSFFDKFKTNANGFTKQVKDTEKVPIRRSLRLKRKLTQ